MPETNEKIRNVALAEELSTRYLSYAMSTIVDRALPDVRDGLKPVHRRLLYAMRQLHLDPKSGFKKCARVVGDVIGKYHPHGDTAVYGAMCRLAQDFSVRYPLVDGQGNFGNIDGDSPAAMRYTEARLTEFAIALMDGLNDDAVDFRDTYDGEECEPVVMPGAVPNLLCNGSAGIAVGMATEIPYQVIKSKLIERIALLLQEKKVPLLSDIRDESAQDVRIVLEPKSRNVDAGMLMELLFKQTELETRFNMNMNVLDSDNVPRVMSIKEVLQEFLRHRQIVLQRRTNYRLQKIISRLEILSGYLIAYLNLDEIIRIIREEDDAKAVMMQTFQLTENQAEAILNMKLRSLRRLEETEIRGEYNELSAEKTTLEALMADEGLRWQKVAEEIKTMRDKFGKKTALGRRRTEFAEVADDIEISIEALVEKEPITVILSQKGWIRCVKGHVPLTDEFKFKDDDALLMAIHAQTTDKIILFDNSGKFFNINGSEIPSGRGFGQPLRLMIDLGNNDNICTMFTFEPKASYLIASNSGRGFVVDENHLIAQTRNGRKIMNLAAGEEAIFCKKITGDMVALIGDNRKLLVFKIEEIPTMARGRGVTLQKYKDGGLADMQIFNESEGFTYTRAGGTKTETDLISWLGHRAQVGKLAPFGFPKNNKFLKD